MTTVDGREDGVFVTVMQSGPAVVYNGSDATATLEESVLPPHSISKMNPAAGE